MAITQQQYNVSNQKKRIVNVVVQLLNKSFQVLDELQGVVIGGSINITNDTIRRSCSLTIFAKDSTFEIKEDGKIWLDKYVKILIEEFDINTKEYVTTNMGIFVMTNPTQVYSLDTNTLQLECLDMMCLLNGYVEGNLYGESYIIKTDENVRNAIIAILEKANVTKYAIEEIPETVPFDIVVDASSNYFALLSQLRDILPNYQMYFDVDGTFIFSEIPINSNETIVADDSLLSNKIVSWSKVTDFSSIKNAVIVIGKTHDIEHFDDSPTYNSNNNLFTLSVSSISTVYDGTKFGFIATANATNPNVKINNSISVPLKVNLESDKDVVLTNGTYYVMTYIAENDEVEGSIDYFKFYGEITAKAIAKDENADSEFNVFKLPNKDITLMGGEYDNIYSSDLALQRAEWEVYSRTRLQETITLNVLPMYCINNINEVIELTLPNKQQNEETNQYIINSTSFDFDVTSTQQLNISRYYPFYIE